MIDASQDSDNQPHISPFDAANLEEDHSQLSLFPEVPPNSVSPEQRRQRPKTPAKTFKNLLSEGHLSQVEEEKKAPMIQPIQGVPKPILPTRWEGLKTNLGNDIASLFTIIRPIPKAMQVIDRIIRYIETTRGCQLFVIRGDTGSGKTTFLNTLPHYMSHFLFYLQTIEVQNLSGQEFAKILWSLHTPNDGRINVIILEGRENRGVASETDEFIQVVLANINRFARVRNVPLLFVIPTPEVHVARSWCEHAQKIGDLIPETVHYEGSRWYDFPGVPKEEYVVVAEETVRTLNHPRSLYDFGISPEEIKSLAEISTTIGRLIETLAVRITNVGTATTLTERGKRDHVWIVCVCPDTRHFDHTYLLIGGLCQDEQLHVSPVKLIPPGAETSYDKDWKDPLKWRKLITTINLLDIRIVNLPIVTMVTTALAYGDKSLLQSFKTTKLEAYKADILKEFPQEFLENRDRQQEWWNQPLINRRFQYQNARESLERTNLYYLLKGMPAREQKRLPEPAKLYAQYLHLRKETNARELHGLLGQALMASLKYNGFPGLISIPVETPFIDGQTDPVPDITIRTETDNYLLEFNFMQKSITASEMTRYTLQESIEKYMRSLPYLVSILRDIKV